MKITDLSQNDYTWSKLLSKKPANQWAQTTPQVGAGGYYSRVKPQKHPGRAKVSALGSGGSSLAHQHGHSRMYAVCLILNW